MRLISTAYAFTSAYLKGEESRCVFPEHLHGMLQKLSIPDAVEVIRNTDIGGYLKEKPIKNFNDVDIYLWRYLAECLQRLDRFKPPHDTVRLGDVYIQKYDILNTKIALRQVLMGEKSPMASVGVVYSHGLLEELSNTQSVGEIAELLEQCQLRAYAVIVKDIKKQDTRTTVDAEARLDLCYYDNLTHTVRNMEDGRLLGKAVGMLIDLTNLQVVFLSMMGGKGQAAGKAIIEGGCLLSGDAIKKLMALKATGIVGKLEHTAYYQIAREMSEHYEKGRDMALIDKVVDRHKFRLLKELISPRVLSPADTLWYLTLKEFEIRNVRLILKALADGLLPSEIWDYLVIVL